MKNQNKLLLIVGLICGGIIFYLSMNLTSVQPSALDYVKSYLVFEDQTSATYQLEYYYKQPSQPSNVYEQSESYEINLFLKNYINPYSNDFYPAYIENLKDHVTTDQIELYGLKAIKNPGSVSTPNVDFEIRDLKAECTIKPGPIISFKRANIECSVTGKIIPEVKAQVSGLNRIDILLKVYKEGYGECQTDSDCPQGEGIGDPYCVGKQLIQDDKYGRCLDNQCILVPGVLENCEVCDDGKCVEKSGNTVFIIGVILLLIITIYVWRKKW